MLSTANVKTGGGTSKTIEPGNVQAKINSISVKPFSLKPENLEIILNLETKPVGEGFEGFFIDPQDQSRGRHLGQVGRAKTTQWAYSDGKTKTGIAISRDNEMMKDLKRLCEQLGEDAVQWFVDQDGKHMTIESLFEAFERDQVYKDRYLNFCVAGKEYMNKQGFPTWDLFLPRFSKAGVPFEKEGAKPSRLITFNPNDHIIKKEKDSVSSFNDSNTSSGEATAAPNTEFEL